MCEQLTPTHQETRVGQEVSTIDKVESLEEIFYKGKVSVNIII